MRARSKEMDIKGKASEYIWSLKLIKINRPIQIATDKNLLRSLIQLLKYQKILQARSSIKLGRKVLPGLTNHLEIKRGRIIRIELYKMIWLISMTSKIKSKIESRVHKVEMKYRQSLTQKIKFKN